MKIRAALLIAAVTVTACGGEKAADPAQAKDQAKAAGELPPGIPRLAASATAAEGFVPAGWTLERQASGDLSGDGVSDLVLILKGADPKKVVENQVTGDATIDSNPRILAVALGEAQGGYRLAVQNHRLIPVRADAKMEDPIAQEPLIENGAGSLQLDFFQTEGRPDSGPYTFRFRQHDGAVRLIGYERKTTHRQTGATQHVTVDLLTGARTDAAGTIGDDQEKSQASRASLGPIPLDQVGDGFAFEADQLKG